MREILQPYFGRSPDVTRRRPVSTYIAVGVISLFAGIPACAYEAKAVENGGTIRGTVVLSAATPEPGNLEITKDHRACGADITDERLLVRDGLVQNAVVSIEGIKQGKQPVDSNYRLENVGCRFVPHVQTIQVGAKLAIINLDPVLHNTHGTLQSGKTVFNIALPLQNQQIQKRIKKPGVMQLKCDAGHTWMSAYVVSFPHPYHATTGEDGSFTMDDIPPGMYTVSVWHEELPPAKIEITVKEGESQSLTIELEKGDNLE